MKNFTLSQLITMEQVTHRGGCHCGAVRFEVIASEHLVIWHCNCSICKMKSNLHFIVPEKDFKLIKGEDSITTYTFNTHQAKHTFCKICGVQSFYRPRSNPDGYGVNPNCLDEGTVKSTETKHFDGQNWENYIEQSGIQKLSKYSFSISFLSFQMVIPL
eukprot:TRINITY_DN2849_c0_g1_i2.p1 TRINITY_DN2849_c0_g1~~TRINITY_DN2849_c0_g1_i2.p1  ORF type:complete len:159 (+),score=23.80 TRINITY_DN2849_c0_g1_i2:62-538(+)